MTGGDERTLADRVELLRTVGSIAYRVSPRRDGWRSSTLRAYHSQILFGRVFDIGTSILRLCEVSGATPDAKSVLDPASIAALTRNLLEAHDSFWHLVVERTSEEESEFRSGVWNVHYHAEAKRVADVLEPEYSRLWSVHESLLIQAVRLLEENPIFRRLPDGKRRMILRGGRPTLGRVRNPRRSQYLTADAARAFYKYLSNQTHSHPFGVHMAAPARWEPAFGRRYLLASCIDVSAREMALATHDYVRRMRRCDGKLSADELELLEVVPRAPWNVKIR